MADIHLDADGAVAVITVDNPERKNAMTPAMGARMLEVCDEVDRRPELGAAVLRGAGGGFCSGADTTLWTEEMQVAGAESWDSLSAVYDAFRRVGQLQVPVVAAVRGAAVGAGANLMLAADLRIVGEDARLIAGFLRIGLHPGGGFFTIANRSAGREATAAFGLFGEQLSGRDAARIGLTWEALPDEQVEPRALELAARAGHDPLLARRAVATFRKELGPPGVSWENALEIERGVQMWSLHRRFVEGVEPAG